MLHRPARYVGMSMIRPRSMPLEQIPRESEQAPPRCSVASSSCGGATTGACSSLSCACASETLERLELEVPLGNPPGNIVFALHLVGSVYAADDMDTSRKCRVSRRRNQLLFHPTDVAPLEQGRFRRTLSRSIPHTKVR